MFQDGSEGPPTYSRERCKLRQQGHSLYEPAPLPAARRARNAGLAACKQTTNFTHAHGPQAAVPRVKPRRSAAVGQAEKDAESLRISHAQPARPQA